MAPKPPPFKPGWGTGAAPTTTVPKGTKPKAPPKPTGPTFKPGWGGGAAPTGAPAPVAVGTPLIDFGTGGGSNKGFGGGVMGNLRGLAALIQTAPQAGAGMLKEGLTTGINLVRAQDPVAQARENLQTAEQRASQGVPQEAPLESLARKFPLIYHTTESLGRTGYRATHWPEAVQQYADAYNRGEVSFLASEDAANIAIVAGAAGRFSGARSIAPELSVSEAAAVTGERAAPAYAVGAEAAPPITGGVRGRITSTLGGAEEYLSRLPSYLREESRAPLSLRGKGVAGAFERAEMPRAAAATEAVGDVFRGVRFAGERVGNAPFAPYATAIKGLSQAVDVANPWFGKAFSMAETAAAAVEERRPGIRGLVTRAGLEVLHRSEEPSALNERLRAAMWRVSPEGTATRADIADIERRSVEATRAGMAQGTAVQEAVNVGRVSAEEGARAGRVALFAVDQQLEPIMRVVEQFGDRIKPEQFAASMAEMYARGGRPVEPNMRPTMADVLDQIAYRKGELPENVQQLATEVEATQRHLSGVREEIVSGQSDWQRVEPDPNVPGDVAHYERIDDPTGARATIDQPLNPEQLQAELMPSEIRRAQQDVEKRRDRQQREWERRANENARDQRVLDAHAAVNATLPDPPTPRQVRNATLFERRQAAERTQYRTLQASLDDAIGAYVRASEVDAPAAHIEALNNLDRAEKALKDQRAQIARLEKWSDEQQVFGRAAGVEEGPPRLQGETAAEYATRQAEWQMEQSVKQLEQLNEQYGLNQARRPEVDVGGARSQLTDIKATAKQIATEQSQAARARVEQIAGTDVPAISPREGVQAGGEYDWWNEPKNLGLDPKTKARLLTEGWVRPETVIDEAKGAARPIDPATGKPKPGRANRVPNTAPRITPDDFTSIINSRLGTAMGHDEAMGVYIDAIRELWDVSQKSDHVIELTAQEMGLPRHQVQAAVRGRISDYGGLLAGEANTAIDDLATAAAALTDEERATFSGVFDDLVAEGGGAITLDSMEELLSFYFPGLDVGSQEGLLAALDGATDLTALGDWLRGGARTPFPEQLRVKLGELGPSQYRQQGAIGQQIGAAKREGRSLEARYNQAQAAVDKALQQGEDAQAKASDRIDAAQENLVEGEPVQGPTMKIGNAMPGAKAHLRRQWYDKDGVLHTAEMSPAERARLRQGQLEMKAARSRVQMNRARLAVERSNLKIADMPAELARSLQDRVVEINQRGVRSMVSGVQSMSQKMGGLTGRGDAAAVTGLMGRLARKYGFADDLHQYLAEAHSNASAVGELLGAADEAAVFDMLYEQYANEHMSVQDANAWHDAKHAAILTDEINQVLADNGGALRLNAPHRVKQIIDQYDGWNMPAEVRNRIEDGFDRWHRARVKTLDKLTDAHARAMPAVYRELHFTAKRAVSQYLDLAERMNQAHPGSGDVFLDAAETVITTMQKYADTPEINPAHLIGGAAPIVGRGRGTSQFAGRAGRIGTRNIGTQVERRTGLRELDVDAYARREAKRAEDIAYNQRDQWVIDKYGTPAREIPLVRETADRRMADTGEHLSSGEIDRLAETAGYVKANPSTKGGESTIYLRRQIKAALAPPKVSSHLAIRGLHRLNQVFKSMVLALSTRWLTGNVFGNIFQAWVNAGVGPVALLDQWLKVQDAMGGFRKSWEKEGVYEGAPAQLSQHGLSTSEYRLKYGGTDMMPRTIIGRTIQRSYRLNQWVDNMVRNAVYFKKLGEGVPSEAAMQTVARSLGDYTRLTPFERGFVREVMPFYAWLRHSTMAMLRLPFTSPARFAMLLHMSTLFADPHETNAALNFMGGKFPLGDDKFLDLAGNWGPFPDVDETQFGPFDPRAIGGQFSPGVKLGFGLLTGLNTATWEQYSRPAKTRARNVFGSDAATPTWFRAFSDPLEAGKETLWQISQASPTQVRSIRDIIIGSDKRYSGSGAIQTGDQAGNEPNRELVPSILKTLGLPYVYTLPEGLRKEP